MPTKKIQILGGLLSDVATTDKNGLMSAADKAKLDSIAKGANNYTHPTHTERSKNLYKVAVDSAGHVSDATAVTKSDITALGIPAQDTTYSAATTSKDGLMSAGDKGKLDGIAAGATKVTVDSALSSSSTNPVQNKVINAALAGKSDSGHTHSTYVNQNSFSNVKVGETTIAADSTTDTLTLEAGSNVTITPDATNDKITIAAKDTTYSAATTSTAGLMSATDKTKLDGIATGAEVNQNAFGKVVVGSTTIAADAEVDTLTLEAGSNITLTPDAAGDKVTIAAKDTTYSAATTSAAGLMSASDKTKLDGIASGANAYSLPTASASTLGGVKVGTNLSISSGVLSAKDTTYSVATQSAEGLMSATDKVKLDGIATGATKVVVDSTLSSTSTNPVQNKVIHTALAGKADVHSHDYIPTSQKGVASGVATLDSAGKVPTSQLPSYVDDVIEATSKSAFPSTGEVGKIYVDTATNKTYRWGGSAYVEISASLAIGTTSSTAAAGNHTHSAATQSAAGFMSAADKKKLDGVAEGANKYSLPVASSSTLGGVKVGTNLTISDGVLSAKDTTYGSATQSSAGLMSKDDKTKLDGIAIGAQVNQNAFSNIKVGDTTISADSTTDTLTIAAGSNITVTPDATNDKVTISATVPTKTSQLTNDSGFKTTDNNTTYSLSKSGSTITLTGSDGKTTSVTDSNTTYDVATTDANGLMSASDKSKLDGIASGANNYTHPSHTAKSSGLYKITVDGSGHVSGATAVTKSDITGLGIPSTNTTYNTASTSTDGLMSKADKSKLDGVAAGANKTVVDSTLNSTSINPVQNKVVQAALDGKADKSRGIFYIEGGGTTDTTNKVATWTGSHSEISEYYSGLMLAYKIGTAGSTTTTLNINNLGAVKVVKNASSDISTNFAVNSVIFLVYTIDDTTAYWKAHDYDANTRNSVGDYRKNSTKLYFVGTTSSDSSTSSSYATSYTNSNIYVNTSNVLYSAEGFKGDLEGNADTATKATQDGNGKNISETYATKSVATTSADGLMSKGDKSKLDGIAAGANNYSHPTSSGNKHIPSGGSSGQILRWSADGTAAWGADNNTTYSAVTAGGSTPGLMTGADKSKLDGIASGAEVNQNAFSNVVVGSTTIAADSKTDTLTLVGDNVTITPDDTNDKVTIGITKDNVTSALGYTPPTTNTTYSAATQSAAGLLSADDKKKLDGIASGANAYSHPSYTARTGKPTANATPGFGETVTISQITSDNTGHVSNMTDRTITIPKAVATTSADGLMSATDKEKLDGIAEGANNYSHPTYTERTGVPTTNQTPSFGGTFSVTQPVSDATGHITAMHARTVTIPNSTATTTVAGLMSAADKSKLDGIASSADTVSFSRSLTSGTKVGTITINGTGTDLYAPTNTDTHYASGTVVNNSATATTNTTTALTNGNVYINHIENGAVKNSHKISGSGATTVTTDTSSNIVIGVNEASQSASGLMSKGDKSKLDGIASGANAYTHPTYTARTGKPTGNATPAFGGTFTVSQITSDETGHVTGATDRTITIPNSTASSSAAGLMSSTDKSKLDDIASGANKYTHPSYTAKSNDLYSITVDSSGHVSEATVIHEITSDEIRALFNT